MFEKESDDPIIFKGDNLPIGSAHFKKEKIFTESNFTLKQGAMLYTFSDGYTDQFNKEGKFTAKRLKLLLNQIKTFDMETQKEHLKQNFLDWKGNHPQTDDVLIVGIRL